MRFLSICLPLLAFAFLSCGGEEVPCSTCVDNEVPYIEKGNDIANYETVKIGDQTWMAENLDYDVAGSKCYGNQESKCTMYGRLYDWATAMALPPSCNFSICPDLINEKHRGICPSGWHIPSNEEWDKLISYVESDTGCSWCAAILLKSSSGWNRRGNGRDSYGFSALPGGDGDSRGRFDDAGYNGYWLSSFEIGNPFVYRIYMFYDIDGVSYDIGDKDHLFSVRCVED
jgi:uncharacterized protein (TIGR02145 family)